MKNLVFKDLKGAKWSLLSYLILTFIMYLPMLNKNSIMVKNYKDSVFQTLTNINLFYFSIVFLMIALDFIIIRNTNKKLNTNKLLRSLPIDSKSIIGSAFLEPIVLFLLFILVGLGISFTFSLLIGVKMKINLGILSIIFIIFYLYASITLSLALLYPESLMVSYLRSIPMFLFIILIALFNRLIDKLGIDIVIIHKYIPQTIVILLIFGVLVTIFMYKFSLNEFIKKDF